jgi:hypothetical protein
MAPDATASSDGTAAEVMASVDSSSDGASFVIADVTRDDAWLAMPVAEAPALPEWQ